MTAILILSAGRRVSLVRSFADAATHRGIRVIAADMRPGMSSACQVANEAVELPAVAASEIEDEE